MNKRFIDLVLSNVLTKNNAGFVDFTFAPEFEKTEEYSKVVKGMIVKEDFKSKKSFKVNLVIVKFFKDDPEELKQESEIVEIEVLYSTILDAIKQTSTVNTYSELAILDLFRQLESDEIIGSNFNVLSNITKPQIY